MVISADDVDTQVTSDHTLSMSKPKRPKTAYFLFAEDKRPEIRLAHPEASVATLSKFIGAQWHALSDDDKKVYLEQADRAKQTYQTEMAEYRRMNPQEAADDKRSSTKSNTINTSEISLASSAFPIQRVKDLMKADSDVCNVSREALLLTASSLELFLLDFIDSSITAAHRSASRKLSASEAHLCAKTAAAYNFLIEDLQPHLFASHKNIKSSTGSSYSTPLIDANDTTNESGIPCSIGKYLVPAASINKSTVAEPFEDSSETSAQTELNRKMKHTNSVKSNKSLSRDKQLTSFFTPVDKETRLQQQNASSSSPINGPDNIIRHVHNDTEVDNENEEVSENLYDDVDISIDAVRARYGKKRKNNSTKERRKSAATKRKAT